MKYNTESGYFHSVTSSECYRMLVNVLSTMMYFRQNLWEYQYVDGG